MLSCHPPDRQRRYAPLFAAILAARGWRVSRRNARVGACPRAAARRSDRSRRLRLQFITARAMDGWPQARCRLVAGCRAARCRIHLEARNASIARVGLLGLLAQDHGLVAAADRARRRLEAERGALGEAELGRSSQNRRDQTHRRDTRLHGQTSARPMRPQRTIPLIVPGGTGSSGGKVVAGRPVHVVRRTPRFKLVARSFVPIPTALAPASPISRSPRQFRASYAWPRDRSFAARGRALPRRAPASAWDH